MWNELRSGGSVVAGLSSLPNLRATLARQTSIQHEFPVLLCTGEDARAYIVSLVFFDNFAEGNDLGIGTELLIVTVGDI